MRVIRTLSAIESITGDDDVVAFAEKEWICDPWIRKLVASRADAIEVSLDQLGGESTADAWGEISPPLLPGDRISGVPRRGDLNAPDEE